MGSLDFFAGLPRFFEFFLPIENRLFFLVFSRSKTKKIPTRVTKMGFKNNPKTTTLKKLFFCLTLDRKSNLELIIDFYKFQLFCFDSQLQLVVLL